MAKRFSRERQARIRRLLGRPMTVRELSRRMGMTYNDALRSMKGMRQSGEVVQVGTGGHSGRAAIMQLAEVA